MSMRKVGIATMSVNVILVHCTRNKWWLAHTDEKPGQITNLNFYSFLKLYTWWQECNFQALFIKIRHDIRLMAILKENPGKRRNQNISILDFVWAKDDEGGGDNWTDKMHKARVKSPPTTNHHPTFYRSESVGWPS